jgi:tetratricopeptide (TPR) repeat protein
LQLTFSSFSIILERIRPQRFSQSGGGLPSPSSDLPGRQPLAGQLIVFTGKPSSLGRKDARALVARLGGATSSHVTANTTMLVVRAERGGVAADEKESRGEGSNKLKRAQELNAGGARIQIISEADFCRLAGVPTLDTVKRQYHATRGLLANYRALREDHLRYLVKYGLIRPVLQTNGDTFFTFPDLAAIKQANNELERGASFRAVVRTLLAARNGQLAFDFRLDAEPAKIIRLGPRTLERVPAVESHRAVVQDTALAEDYFRTGSTLDDGDEAHLELAATAYRKGLELDPYLVPALINLANIHYGRNELEEAQALYERAIGLEPDFFEAHFNLGNIYHDLGRFPEALTCYREALRRNPSYADAHFYLAVTCEKLGLSQDAKPHWRAYQRLAPHGEWVELAKEFSE